MTFPELWNALVAKDVRLENPEAKIEFKSANLKRLLEQVYEQGGKRERDQQPARDGAHKFFDDILRGNFGR